MIIKVLFYCLLPTNIFSNKWSLINKAFCREYQTKFKSPSLRWIIWTEINNLFYHWLEKLHLNVNFISIFNLILHKHLRVTACPMKSPAISLHWSSKTNKCCFYFWSCIESVLPDWSFKKTRNGMEPDI